jgi:magnesium-transporting ATPase (P-type)
MKFDNNKKIILVIFVFITILFYFSYAVYALNQSSIYLENGLLENIQVITLFLACVSFIFPVFSQSRSDKLMLMFFSFLCFSFILREVDVEVRGRCLR